MRFYKYEPLKRNEIRLIELKGSSIWSDPIELIHIRHVSLNNASQVSFEALSYAWGDPTGRHPLYCGDGSYLMITESLFSALRNLRQRNRSRLLWVDAVCINQDDLRERGLQVALMKQIYQTSECTLVYLGDEADNSLLALTFLDYFLERLNQKRENWDKQGKSKKGLNALSKRAHKGIAEMKRSGIDTTDEEEDMAINDNSLVAGICARAMGSSAEGLFFPFPQELTQKALVALLCRPWFQRAWVIQEFAVAKYVDMYCGRRLVKWTAFMPAFTFSFDAAKVTWGSAVLPSQRLDFYRGLKQMLEMHSLYGKSRGKEPHRKRLSWLLSTCRTANATLAVDKLYSLYGLSSDFSDFSNHSANYYAPKASVYTRQAVWHIYKSEGKELLYEASRSDRTSSDMPSWVPDWSEVPIRHNLGKQWSKTSRWLFKAGGKQNIEGIGRREGILMESGPVLSIMGFVLQTILILGHPEDRGIECAPNLSHLQNVLSDVETCKSRMSRYPTGEKIDIVMDCVLEADQPRDPENVTSWWDNNTARDILAGIELNCLENQGGKGTIMERFKNSMAFKNATRAIAGRRLAVTDKSYVGLVPTATQRGDKVCVLYGFVVPFILRRKADHYILVGDCYMHGLMQGEIFDLKPPPVLQDIKIH
jgi:Heterokaryon incompatibility protein (HET)